MTAHVGCWQVAMAALGDLETPVNLLMRREDGDVDRLVFEHRGVAAPLPDHRSRGGVRRGAGDDRRPQARRGPLGDGRPPAWGATATAWPPTFSALRCVFPFSAYKLASATGAPIAVLLSRKLGPRAYTLDLARVIEVPPGLGRGGERFCPYVAQLAQCLEGFVAQDPYQFFNFFDLWATAAANDGDGGARSDATP